MWGSLNLGLNNLVDETGSASVKQWLPTKVIDNYITNGRGGQLAKTTREDQRLRWTAKTSDLLRK